MCLPSVPETESSQLHVIESVEAPVNHSPKQSTKHTVDGRNPARFQPSTVFPLKKSSKISWTWTCLHILAPFFTKRKKTSLPAVPGVVAESRPPGRTFEQLPAHVLDILGDLCLPLTQLTMANPMKSQIAHHPPCCLVSTSNLCNLQRFSFCSIASRWVWICSSRVVLWKSVPASTTESNIIIN